MLEPFKYGGYPMLLGTETLPDDEADETGANAIHALRHAEPWWRDAEAAHVRSQSGKVVGKLLLEA